MKKLLILLLVTCMLPFSSMTVSLAGTGQPNTIPALQQWTGSGADFTFTASTRIVLNTDNASQLQSLGEVFADDLLKLTNQSISVVNGTTGGANSIYINLSSQDNTIGQEGYELSITSSGVIISAKAKEGAFNGTRTLLQLLKQSKTLKGGTAKDWPMQKERATMIDVARKYFTVNWLKNHIRELSYLKYNYLYLHLTDNEAFRLECDTYPEIVSAQHYTKAEIADLVAFASKYNITVIPEIEMPGHLGAALSKHPELQLTPITIDITKPASITFLENIIQEYITLFPGKYFSTGMDEYLTDAEYPNYPQLLSYAKQQYGENATAKDAYYGFINKINAFVKANGKIMRIWNDGVGRGTAVTVDKDIVIDVWLIHGGYTAQEFLDEGYTISNSNTSRLYYVLGIGWASTNGAKIYDDFEANLYVNNVTCESDKTLGVRFQLWCDYKDAESEEELENSLADILRALSQKAWGSAKIAENFEGFKSVMLSVGNAPGYTGQPFKTAVNIAIGKTATASREYNVGANVWTADKAVDGNIATRWAADGSDIIADGNTAWFKIDLGGRYSVKNIVLNWEAAFAKTYDIQISDDNSTWTTIYSTTTGNGGAEDTGALDKECSYIKLLCKVPGTMYGYSLYEFQVFGEKIADNNITNVAVGKTATASKEYNVGANVWTADKAVDGNIATRWAADGSDIIADGNTAWFKIDLGGRYSIKNIVLNWEAAFAKTYDIQISDDNSTWTTIYSTTTGNGGAEDTGALDKECSYIKLLCKVPGTNYGYSLYEFQVFGEKIANNNITNVAIGKTATASKEYNVGANVWTAAKTVDGNLTTKWSAEEGDIAADGYTAWLKIDLGGRYSVKNIVMHWQSAFAKTYDIQISDDNSTWTTIYSTTAGAGGVEDTGVLDKKGRYIKLLCKERGTIYGYSLFEFEVFGQKTTYDYAINTVTANENAINVNISNCSNPNSSAVLLVAIYKNNVLQKVVTEKIIDNKTEYIFNSDLSGVTKVKAYIWQDIINIKTLSNPLQYIIE